MRDLLCSFFTRHGPAVAAASAADASAVPIALSEIPTPAHQCDVPMHEHRHFPPAALVQQGLTPGTTAQLCVVHLNSGVQHAAEALQRDLHRLVDASALGLIARAVERARDVSSDLRSSQVLASLQEMRADVAREIAAAQDERETHGAALRDAFAPVQALRCVVAQQAATAGTEAQSLRRRLQALDQWHGGQSQDPHQVLRQHLTEGQLAALGIPDNATAIAEVKARLATLDAFVAACTAFHDDEGSDVCHLHGLGFDAAVHAARAAGAVLPA